MAIETYKVALGRNVTWPSGAVMARSHQLFDADIQHPAFAFLLGQSHKYVLDGAGEGTGGVKVTWDEQGARYLAERGWDPAAAAVEAARAIEPEATPAAATPRARGRTAADDERAEIMARVDKAQDEAAVDAILREYGYSRRNLAAWRRQAEAEQVAASAAGEKTAG